METASSITFFLTNLIYMVRDDMNEQEDLLVIIQTMQELQQNNNESKKQVEYPKVWIYNVVPRRDQKAGRIDSSSITRDYSLHRPTRRSDHSTITDLWSDNHPGI